MSSLPTLKMETTSSSKRRLLITNPFAVMSQNLRSLWMIKSSLCSCDRASWTNCGVREKTNKMQHMLIFNNISTCFGHHYAHLQENKTYYCMWCAALVLLDVVGSGCSVTFTVLAPYKAAPHNRYQPHPAEPAQHTTCSNTSCSPEDGHNDARNMLRYC